MIQIGEIIPKRSRLRPLHQGMLFIVGLALILAALGSVFLTKVRPPRPWEALPSPEQGIARSVLSMDPICSGILAKEARFTESTTERIAWDCTTRPWGHRFEEEARCVSGHWTARKYEWQGIPDGWQPVEGVAIGPPC